MTEYLLDVGSVTNDEEYMLDYLLVRTEKTGEKVKLYGGEYRLYFDIELLHWVVQTKEHHDSRDSD